jgi:hypothetical protein
MLEFDSAATFFMTGNSLKILGDMIRRTIKLQIDPEGVNPIDRSSRSTRWKSMCSPKGSSCSRLR